jgi:serine/threonine protein kinase
VLEKLGKTLHDVIETEWKLADPSYASSYAKKSILSHYENSFANFWNPLLLSAADEGSEGTNTNKTSRGEAYTAQSLLLDRIWALLDIARGMQCLHQHHILMRDLKTENLAYAASTGTEERKVLKLFDFGLARACYAPIQDEGMIGTLKIMAPEVIQGTPFGLQADVYSFAITAVEVFSCQDSHLGVDVATHIQRVVAKSRPPRPAGMPEVIWKLIEKCWEQDPEKRPGFDEVFLVLDEFAKSLPGVPLTGIDAASDSLSMNGINSKGVSSNLRNERLTDESPTDGAPKSVEITVGL